MNLSEASVNKEYIITHVCGDHARRLLDMGFTPGSKIKVDKIAPFGGTVLVCIRGISVALRRNATNSISVEAV